MEPHTRQRLYYVPGLISLTLLPIVFHYCATSFLASNTLVGLDAYWYNMEEVKKDPDVLPVDIASRRSFTSIILTGNETTDEIKLNFAQIRIREILSLKDTVNGIRFEFTDSANFSSIVKSFDILYIEHAQSYIPIDRSIWFLYMNPKPVQENSMTGLGCCLCFNHADSVPKTTWWTDLSKISWWGDKLTSFQIIWKSSWKLIVSYGAFLLSIAAFKFKFF